MVSLLQTGGGIGVPKNRGYKPLLQEIHPSKNRGYKPLLQKITIPFPEEIHVDVGVSSLHLFLFLLLKQQKPGTFMLLRGFRLGACCLTILIYTV